MGSAIRLDNPSQAFAVMLKRDGGKVSVGFDGRLTSPELEVALREEANVLGRWCRLRRPARL